MSEIKASPEVEKAIAAFHDASMRRMAESNAADVPTEALFHYTNERALFSIIESETFWFTSIYYMDDTEELAYGFNVSQSMLQDRVANGDQLTRLFCEELVSEEDLEKIRTLFEFYSISFGTKDDAQQWERYGDKGCGVALGLSPKFFHPVPLEDPENPKPEKYIFFGKVAYGNEAARARHSVVIDEAIEVIKQAQAGGAIRDGKHAQIFFRHIAAEMTVEILWNCVTTKDQKWSHQNETRLLALNNLKAPHLPIYNADIRPRLELPQPLLMKYIVEIMVGPKADSGAEERMRRFLKAHSLSQVAVTRSSAPTASPS